MRKEGFLTPKTPFGMTGLGWRSDWGGVEIEEGFHRANFARWCRVLTYVTRRAGMRREEKAGSLRFGMTGGALGGCPLEGGVVGMLPRSLH